MELSLRWAERSRDGVRGALGSPGQALFGIVQGGVLSRACASGRPAALAAMDFPGYAIGGLAVGEGQRLMLEMLATDRCRCCPQTSRAT